MKWFGNRNREGNESEKVDVNPRNQILQTSLDKPTQQEKGKLYRFQDQSPEKQKELLDNASQAVENYKKKLNNTDNTASGDPSIDQREQVKTYDPKSKLTKDGEAR